MLSVFWHVAYLGYIHAEERPSPLSDLPQQGTQGVSVTFHPCLKQQMKISIPTSVVQQRTPHINTVTSRDTAEGSLSLLPATSLEPKTTHQMSASAAQMTASSPDTT